MGTTRPRVNLDQIRNVLFPGPPKLEQQKIASILSSADFKIYGLESNKSTLKILKKGLMQYILTGKIRVKV